MRVLVAAMHHPFWEQMTCQKVARASQEEAKEAWDALEKGKKKA